MKPQIVGIPMGGNASPDIANLYCYWCEKLFIDSLVNKGDLVKARTFAHCFRFIDDFLTWNVEPPPASIYQMAYTETTKGDNDVIFLGMRIRIQEDDFIRLSISDKTDVLPFAPVKYTHAESVHPRNTGASILKGCLIRTARVCNNLPDFKVEMMRVYYRLRDRGYRTGDLRRTFLSFLMEVYDGYDGTQRALRNFFGFVINNYELKKPPIEEQPSIRQRRPPSKNPIESDEPNDESPRATKTSNANDPPDTEQSSIPTPGELEVARIKATLRGLPNPARTCYFNATVQSVMRNQPFLQYIEKAINNNRLDETIGKVINMYVSGSDTSYSDVVSEVRQKVLDKNNIQILDQDAHEIYSWMKNRAATSANLTPDENLTITQTYMTCQCGFISDEKDKVTTESVVYTLNLNEHESDTNSQRTLNLDTVLSQNLDVDEAIPGFRCPDCGKTGTATKSQRITAMPSTLDVLLVRHHWEGDRAVKLKVRTTLPATFMTPHGVYEAKNVVIHCGRMNNPHYVALVKSGSQWTRFDDAAMVPLDDEQVHQTCLSGAYLLTLQRCSGPTPVAEH